MTNITHNAETYTVNLYETGEGKPNLQKEFLRNGIKAQAFCTKGKSKHVWLFNIKTDGTISKPSRVM